MHSKATRYKLQETEIQLDIRKKKCTVRVTKHRNRSTARCSHHLFASVFTGKCSSHTAQVAEGKGRDWENEEPPTVEDQVRDHLRNLKVHKSMGPDEMYLQVLRQLADEVAKPLSTISEKSWQPGEVPTDCLESHMSND